MGTGWFRLVPLRKGCLIFHLHRELCVDRQPGPCHFSIPILLMVLFLLLPTKASAVEPGTRAVLAHWQASAFSEARHGFCCWMIDPAGSLRLEISAPAGPWDNDQGHESLLAWDGDGWTLILGEPGQGTLNRWREQWRNSPPGLERLIRAALSEFPAKEFEISFDGISPSHKGFRPQPRNSSSGSARKNHYKRRWEVSSRFLVLDDDQKSISGPPQESFRVKMIERGSGRGGAAEIFTQEFFIPTNGHFDRDPWVPGTRMLLSSSRRPGRLQLEVVALQLHLEVPSEAFLPLWPLDKFLSPSEIFPGTPSRPEGLREGGRAPTE